MPASTAKPAAKRTTNAKKAAPAKTPPKPAAAKKPEEPKLHGMTKAERKTAAAKIAKLRNDHVKWDGEGGICEQVGIRTALVGRAILREFAHEDLIKPLTGSRAK